MHPVYGSYRQCVCLAILLLSFCWNAPASASLSGTLFDQIRAEEVRDGYWMRVRLSVALPFKQRTFSGVGDSLEIPLMPPTIDGGILNELPFEDTRFPWMEFNVPIREISFNQYDRLNPRITLRFAKKYHYAYNVTENGRLFSIILKSTPITDGSRGKPAENVPTPVIPDAIPDHIAGDKGDLGIDGMESIPQTPSTKPSAKGITKKPVPAPRKGPPSTIAATPPSITKDNDLGQNYPAALEKSVQLITAHKYAQALTILQDMQKPNANNPVAKESLELLGVAYERSGQHRTAQGVYEKFLEKYQGPEDVARVRQRLMMLNTSSVMKTALTTPLSSGNPEFRRESFGSLAQYYYHSYGDNRFDSAPTTSYKRLQNLFDVSNRLRTDSLEFKTVILGAFLHDLNKDRKEHVDFSAMYADLQSKITHLGLRTGRQSSPSGSGILSKFDGVSAFYQYNSRSRILAAAGYPMDYMHKDLVQTDKPLASVSVGLGPWFNTVEITPFLTRQWVKNFVDRTATGFESRIGIGPFSSFAVVDYDTDYQLFNIAMLNGTLSATQDLTLTGLLDYRRAPMLSLSNAALINSEIFKTQQCHAATSDPAQTVADLARVGCSEDDLRRRALELSGDMVTIGGGMTYIPQPEHQFNFDASLARYALKSGDAENSAPTELQANASGMYTRNQLFSERNSAYAGSTVNYSKDQLASMNFFTGAHLVWRGNWHFYNRLAYEMRWMHNAGLLQHYTRPTLRMEYQDNKFHTEYQLEVGLEHQETTKGNNSTGVPDGNRFQFTAGYRWLF